MSNGPLYVCLKKVQEQGGGVATPSPTRHPSRTHVREFSPAIPLHGGSRFKRQQMLSFRFPHAFVEPLEELEWLLPSLSGKGALRSATRSPKMSRNVASCPEVPQAPPYFYPAQKLLKKVSDTSFPRVPPPSVCATMHAVGAGRGEERTGAKS